MRCSRYRHRCLRFAAKVSPKGAEFDQESPRIGIITVLGDDKRRFKRRLCRKEEPRGRRKKWREHNGSSGRHHVAFWPYKDYVSAGPACMLTTFRPRTRTSINRLCEHPILFSIPILIRFQLNTFPGWQYGIHYCWQSAG